MEDKNSLGLVVVVLKNDEGILQYVSSMALNFDCAECAQYQDTNDLKISNSWSLQGRFANIDSMTCSAASNRLGATKLQGNLIQYVFNSVLNFQRASCGQTGDTRCSVGSTSYLQEEELKETVLTPRSAAS